MKTALLLLLLTIPQEGKEIGGCEIHEGFLISREKGILHFQFTGREIDDKWESTEVGKFYLNGVETQLNKIPNRPCYVVTLWRYQGLNTWRLLEVRVISQLGPLKRR